MEAQPVFRAAYGDVLLEDRPHDRQVEPATGDVRVRKGDLHGHTPLGTPHIDERPIPPPGEFLCDGVRRPHAVAGHRLQKLLQPDRVAVEHRKQLASGLDLVLWLAAAEGLGERAPKAIQVGVDHLKIAPDVGGLGPIEEIVRFRRIRVEPLLAFEQAKGDERIEEIAGASRVNLKALTQ